MEDQQKEIAACDTPCEPTSGSGRGRVATCVRSAKQGRRPLLAAELAEARRLYQQDGLSWAVIGRLLRRSASHLHRNCLDISRDLSSAGELAPRRNHTEATRRKVAAGQRAAWANVGDRGSRGRKRGDSMRLMNA